MNEIPSGEIAIYRAAIEFTRAMDAIKCQGDTSPEPLIEILARMIEFVPRTDSITRPKIELTRPADPIECSGDFSPEPMIESLFAANELLRARKLDQALGGRLP